MLKFVLTAVYLGLMICLLYQPLSLPDEDSMINKYRPSLKHQPAINNADQASRNNLKVAIQDLQRDSIIPKESPVFVDSTP